MKLNEYSKEEWQDVIQSVIADKNITDDEFDMMWENFEKMKASKQLQ